MFYLVTVGYESENLDRNGNPRIQKTKYVIEADSAEEVTIVMANYHKGDVVSSSIEVIKAYPLGEVILRENNPLLYKR